jgi:hypothetical protein
VKFFVPGVPSTEAEAAYRALCDSAKEQLRTQITSKRIMSLRYVHDKRTLRLEVGEVHPEQYRYRVVAILESQPHIVMTQGSEGHSGPTFMVNSSEITDVTEFDTV